jgi:hypothetical protein
MTIPGLTEAAIGDIDRAGGFPPSWGRPPAQRIPKSGRRGFGRNLRRSCVIRPAGLRHAHDRAGPKRRHPFHPCCRTCPEKRTRLMDDTLARIEATIRDHLVAGAFSIRRHERCTISSSRQVVCHGRGTEYPFHNRCSGLQYPRSCPLGISRRYGSTISP